MKASGELMATEEFSQRCGFCEEFASLPSVQLEDRDSVAV